MRSAAVAVLCWLLGSTALAGTLGAKPTAFAVGTAVDTYVIWGETQSMVNSDANLAIPSPNTDTERLAAWACANKATYNIKGALAVGDLVENPGTAAEWDVIEDAVTILEGCQIPYIPTYGNHDGVPTVAVSGGDQNATTYHQRVGQDVMDARGWFAGRGVRPDFTETDPSDGSALYLENTTTYGARSFWVPFIVNRLGVISMEWEGGIRMQRGNTTAAKSSKWASTVMRDNPNTYFVLLTHAGPCDVPKNCDLTPEDALVSANQQWTNFIDNHGPNYTVSLNGHWNRGGTGCPDGGGTAKTAVRDDGSRWLVASADFTCNTREDPVAAAVFPGTAYGWQVWLQLRRHSHQFCVQTIRPIDVDFDNDGIAEAAPANLNSPPLIGRGALNDPDPATIVGCTGVGTDAGPNECPNFDTVCMNIIPLPLLD